MGSLTLDSWVLLALAFSNYCNCAAIVPPSFCLCRQSKTSHTLENTHCTITFGTSWLKHEITGPLTKML